MKPLFLFFVLTVFCISIKAQSTCQSSHPLFSFNESAKPEKIYQLGASPQIDFLRNIKKADEFLAAIKSNRNSKKYQKDIDELDKVLKIIGFSNGLDDKNFNQGALTYETIPYGTVGNLGANSEKYSLSILLPYNINGISAWKIKSPNNCSVYIFTKCGNLFFPKPTTICDKECPCREVAINISSERIHLDISSPAIKDTIINYYYMCFNPPAKQKAPQPQQPQQQNQQQRRSNNWRKERSCVLLYSDTTIVNSFTSIAKSFDLSVEELKTVQICNDTTISVKVKISAEQASSETFTPNRFENTSLGKIIVKSSHKIIITKYESVNKKVFKKIINK